MAPILPVQTFRTEPKRKFAALVADANSGFTYKQHGAIFQLSQMLAYQLQANYLDGPKIIDIDGVRKALRLTSAVSDEPEPDGGKAYSRRVDIVLSKDDGETWVELKSLSGPFNADWFESRLTAKEQAEDAGDEARDYYRQFFHDMRMNKIFVKNLDKITEGQNKGNSIFYWHFQDYKKVVSSSTPPTLEDINKARKGFCKLPRGLVSVSDFYKSNISLSVKGAAAECKKLVGNFVDIRDTKSYFETYLALYADELDIQDFVALARAVGE